NRSSRPYIEDAAKSPVRSRSVWAASAGTQAHRYPGSDAPSRHKVTYPGRTRRIRHRSGIALGPMGETRVTRMPEVLGTWTGAAADEPMEPVGDEAQDSDDYLSWLFDDAMPPLDHATDGDVV